MMNFNYFTKYNLLYQEPTNQIPYMPVVEKIIQYGKFFIANQIMSANQTALMEIKDNNSKPNNWLHNFLWQLIVNAKAEQKDEEEIPNFIKDNLSIITFNYDFTVDEIFPIYLVSQDGSVVSNDIISHVYGIAGLYEKDNKLVVKTGKDNLLKYFFNKQSLYRYGDVEITLDKNDILTQLNSYIDWIGETEAEAIEQQQKYRKLVETSKNIYFLGFGFDINNMKRLGLLTAESKFDIDIFKDKTIYISQGSPKVRDFFRTSFDIDEWHKDRKLYTATSTNNTKIIISDNSINMAFREDFSLV